MWESVVRVIRRRTREDWQQLTRQRVDELLAWAHDHGELSAVCGFLFGVGMVIAFRFFLALLFLVALLAFIIWKIALPSNQQLPRQLPNSEVGSTEPDAK
jgi:hypothetical protein